MTNNAMGRMGKKSYQNRMTDNPMGRKGQKSYQNRMTNNAMGRKGQKSYQNRMTSNAMGRKGQKNKAWSSKYYTESIDRATRSPQKPRVNFDVPRLLAVPACFTSGVRRVPLVTNAVLSHERCDWGYDNRLWCIYR
jgi:hypothetical protein